MISAISIGVGPSAMPARPSPEEAAKRFEGTSKPLIKSGRAASEVGASRVHISTEGAQRAQAEAQAPATAALETALDLAFAAADGNRDGTVTISEQRNFEVRTVRINIEQPADGRPGPAGSGPIRAYLDVDATIAGT